MLQGQFEVSTNETGIAYVTGLILKAIPGDYQLVFSMPDYYPQVLFTLPQALCIMVNVAHAHMHTLSTLKP